MQFGLTHIAIFLLSLLSFSALASVDTDDSRVFIPFEVINGMIIIQAEIDNEVGNYIFDTGAEELILNKKVDSSSTMFSSINGDIATEEVRINLLRIGKLTHNTLKAYTADLASMESYLNISLQGVIGCNLFLPRKIKIDFDSNEIILSSTNDLTIGRKDYVKFEMQDGVPVCSVSIGDVEYLFGFDTGATIHVIDENVLSKFNEHASDTGLDTYVSTGTGTKTINKIISLDRMKIGNVKVEDGQFLLQDLNVFNESMNEPIAGVLSLTALECSNIVIDLEKMRIYF